MELVIPVLFLVASLLASARAARALAQQAEHAPRGGRARDPHSGERSAHDD